MMNNANEISHQTKLYGFIGEFAGQCSVSAKLNKILKTNNKDAMMIPMNIREDDFYFTVANMKKSHVNGALISNEYVLNLLDILDDSTEIVKQSGMCDILVRDGEKLIGDVLSINVLNKFIKKNNLNKIAMIGVNHYAKAFVSTANDFEISFYNENLEELMSFVEKMNIKDADINRIVDSMQVDLSRYDLILDFSDLASLDMISKISSISIDMKTKKQFSSLKQRTKELDSIYYGFDELVNEMSEGIFEYFKDKKHLDYDKSDMRF
ncbi:MAG: hypothetical protein COB17_09570 [Sulfurimonas sp.]|nr:MAG: hypothetical protein COB17_09570 [Sulfurimonas sp.]